ncbi:MAG: AAA family ATPase [Pyrinomonadaceae bacterium]
MTFSLHENFNFGGGVENSYEITSTASTTQKPHKSADVHLFADKMSMPKFKNYIKRPRLNEILEKSLTQFGTTLITGRTGTGKSALAANFARQYEQARWFSVEAADCNWNIFSSYFTAIFDNLNSQKQVSEYKLNNSDAESGKISPLVENLICEFDLTATGKPALIVLDDIHNVFDAEWFAEFFTTLLYSLTPNIHLLMLSRSNPSLPLWRLRSKQVLGVIDEKLLAFNLEETKKIFKRYGLSAEAVTQTYRKSFGRISRLKTLAESL